MAGGIKITTNAEQFKRSVEKLRKETRSRIEGICRASALYARNLAVQNVPKNDGFLAGTIYAKQDENNRFSFTVGTPLKYGAYIEFGTRFTTLNIPEELTDIAIEFRADPLKKATNIPSQPWLYPAIQDGRDYLLDQLDKNFPGKKT